MRAVARALLSDHSSVVAPQLLGKVLRVDLGNGDVRSGRITEVEAYGGTDDPASHSYRGPTPRNEPMFRRAGTIYVYFTYGMHWCANIVTGPVGDPQAVLLRAVEPLDGLDAIRTARPRARRDRDLTNGPANLCEGLGIGRWANGLELGRPTPAGGRITLLDDGTVPPSTPLIGPRIGISAGQDTPWRFRVP